MDDQELKPPFTTGTVITQPRISSRAKAMWFAKDSVTTRRPAQMLESGTNMQTHISDDDDPFVDKIAASLDKTHEIPLSRPPSRTPAATPDQADTQRATKDSATITIPVMMHKCRPMFKNGSDRSFGKVLDMQPDEISLKPNITYDEFYRQASNKLLRRFGHDCQISSLQDRACLSKIMVEHGGNSTTTVRKEEWRKMLDSIRIEVMFGRKIVLNLWFASFVEFEKEERKWWRKILCGCAAGN